MLTTKISRSVRLSNGVSYRYQLPWNGSTRLRGTHKRPIAFDTETELIDKSNPAHIPRMALATVSDGRTSFFLRPDQLPLFFQRHAGEHFVGQNIAFDFWVVDQHLRSCGESGSAAVQTWWSIADAGRLHDTLLLDMLIRLAQAVGFEAFSQEDTSLSRRNLGELADGYLGLLVDKNDPFRLRYGELIGVAWADVQETGFWDYAIKDAIVTVLVWHKQVEEAEKILEQTKRQFPQEFLPNALKNWGWLTESLQTRASLALAYMTRRGMRVDSEKAAECEAHLREEIAGKIATMWELEPTVFKYKKQKIGRRLYPLPPTLENVALTPKGQTPQMDKNLLTEALERIASEGGFPAPQTRGKRGVYTSNSVKAWVRYTNYSPFLQAWSEVSLLSKRLSLFRSFKELSIVYPKYNPLMRTGRVSAARPNIQQCFSGDTEILTEAGWVRFDRLQENSRVAQWQDGKINFVVPDRVIAECYNGLLYKLNNDHIDLAITPQHNCLLQDRKSGHLCFYKAALYPEDKKQLHGGVYIPDIKNTLDLSKNELVFLLAFQADGSWSWSRSMDFTFHKQRKIDRLSAVLDRLGVSYKLVRRTGKFDLIHPNRWRFNIKPCHVTEKIYNLLGPHKTFDSWLLKLDRSLLDIFCNEIFFWDGSYKTKVTYTSVIKDNADWVQIILLLSGHRANVRPFDNSKWKGKKIAHVVQHTPRNYSLTTNIQRSTMNAPNSTVYCVTVPSGCIIVRRNGKAVVTGNCPRESDFRSMFIARPGFKILTVDFSFIELRTLAVVCERRFGFSVLADTIRNGIDPHAYTAAIILGMPLADFMALKTSDEALFKDARQKAKALNFGVPGGLGAHKLAAYAYASYGVEMSVEEAAALRDKLIREIYPELALYLSDTSIAAMSWNFGVRDKDVKRAFDIDDERDGPEWSFRIMRAVGKVVRGKPEKADGTPYKPQFVERIWASVRRLSSNSGRLPAKIKEQIREKQGSENLERALLCGPALSITGRVRGSATYTQSRNCPFQSLAADGGKLALWELIKEGFRPIAFVHDEVVLEVPEETAAADAERVEQILISTMESVMDYRLPAACSKKLADCWQK